MVKLSSIDLNLLLVLHAVLEEGSVTKAAARLHVTPPAISNSLARLREVIKDPLLVRSGRGLVPTPRALALKPQLKAAVDSFEQVVSGGSRFDPATAVRAFTIACTDGDQVALIPRVARAFATRLPRCTLHVISVDHLEAAGGVEKAEVDAVIAPAMPVPPGIETAPLYEDEATLVIRKGHPAAKRKLTKAAFNSLRHVDVRFVLGEGGAGNKMAEAFFAQHGLTRNIGVTVPSFTSALLLAAATDLAAGVPRRVAKAFKSSLPIHIAEIPAPPMRFAIHLQWPSRVSHDEGSRYFRQLVQYAT